MRPDPEIDEALDNVRHLRLPDRHDKDNSHTSRRAGTISVKSDDYMVDQEVKRLEDRIDAVNREGQLRLDAVMARIEGKFDTIAEQNRNMESSLAAIRQDVAGTRSTIKNTALASVLAIAGIVFAGIALWGGGFSSGQADRPPAITSPPLSH